MIFAAGDRVGRYRVVREIGHGGMGCVYEVAADDDALHLALKAFTLDHGNREFLKSLTLRKVGLVALTIVGAVVGLAWEFLCRVVLLEFACAAVLAAVVGVLWLIGRVARLLGGR